MKRIIASLSVLGLAAAGFVFFSSDNQAYAAPDAKLSVSIGKSAASASKAKKHDISVAALKKGQKEFEVRNSEQAYKIKLSEKNIEDILKGSTVTVSTVSGDLKVKIGPAKRKPKRSGW